MLPVLLEKEGARLRKGKSTDPGQLEAREGRAPGHRNGCDVQSSELGFKAGLLNLC